MASTDSTNPLAGATNLPDNGWNDTADSVRAQAKTTRLLPSQKYPVDNGLVNLAAIQAGALAESQGEDPNAAISQVVSAGHNNPQVGDAIRDALAQQNSAVGNVQAVNDVTAARQEAQEKEQKTVDSITALDRFSAAFAVSTVTSALAHRMIQANTFDNVKVTGPDFYNWYGEHRAEIEAGHSQDEIQSLRDATSDADLRRIQFDIAQDRDYWNTVTLHGQAGGASTFGYSMLAGIADPVGWVAGAGVGKVGQLVGVGARAAAEAGMVGRSFIYAGLENAAGNVLTEAALDAAGKHTSTGDYFNAAGSGLIFGSALHSFTAFRGMKGAAKIGDAEIKAEGEALRQKAAESNADLYTEAQQRAGNGATSDEILRQAQVVESERGQKIIDDLDAPVPDEQKLGPTVQPDIEPKEVPAANTLPTDNTPAAPGRTYQLPEELSKASPNYSFGSKKFKLDFDNDVDRAAYIIAQKNPSKRDADYLKFVMQATGADEEGARAYGQALRAAIKDQARDAQPGTLKVEPLFQEPQRAVAARAETASISEPVDNYVNNNASGESSASLEAQSRLRDEKANGQQRAVIEPDGTVRPLMGTVDDVDTFARPGQIIAQRGIGKDEWTAISHDASFSPEYAQGRVSAMKEKLDLAHIFSDDELPVGEHFLDMDEDFDGPGTLHAEQELPEASIEGEAKPRDRAREVMLGAGAGDRDQLFPRPPVEGGEAKPILTTEQAIASAARKHNLDINISNETARALLAELAERSDRVVADNPVNPAALEVFGKKIGAETNFTGLMSSKSNIAKAYAITMLEDTPGALASRRATGALTKEMRERAYMQNMEPEFTSSAAAWRNARGGNKFTELFNQKHFTEFNRAVAEAIERGRLGQDLKDLDANVKHAMEQVRGVLHRAGQDQVYVGTVGSQRLENLLDGAYYLPRVMRPEKVAALSPEELRAYVNALSDNMVKNAEYSKDFADELAVQYLERAKLRAQGGFDSPMSPMDLGGHGMLRDALEAMGLSREEVLENLNKYTRGGAKHTKERIPLNLLTKFKVGDQERSLMDLMDVNIPRLVRNYTSRVAGEVAAAKYGIMGEQGFKDIRRGMMAQGATASELEHFDQTAAQFLARPFGDRRSKFADNLALLSRGINMGGASITQLGDYPNAIAALGVKKAFSGVPMLGKMLKDVRKLSKGGATTDEMLASMSKYGFDPGVHQYVIKGLHDTNADFEAFGTSTLTTLDRMIRAGAQANYIASGHRALTAGMIRGFARDITEVALNMIEKGENTTALKDMGFTDDVVAAFKKDWSKAVKTNAEGVREFDIDGITDTDAALKFMQAVHRGSTQIVQEPHIGENNRWVNDRYLRYLAQFRHFGLLSMEKQWKRNQINYGAAKSLGYILASMAFAVPIHVARTLVQSAGMSQEDREKYLDQRLSWMGMARATMNYSAATGILPDIMDVTASGLGLPVTGGRWGAGSNSFLGTVVPAAGTLDEFWKAGKGVGRVTGRIIQGQPPQWGLEASHALHLLPGSRLPYLQGAINMLGN